MMLKTPIADEMLSRLATLQPTVCDLLNESAHHAGFYAGKESHFKLTLVSEVFKDKRLVQRHQVIYRLLNDLLVQGGGTVHALAIHAYTPDEWQGSSPVSPACAGQRRQIDN